ncbi:MAG: hypothetical protein ABI986_02780, partial [Chloroflexota bacterium]
PPPLPRSINPAISEEVEVVLLKALEKRPGDRYQSGKSLMTALRNVLTTKKVETPKDAPPMPPIPVGAPNILRSDISLNSFTKRGDVASALEQRVTTSRHDIEEVLPVAQSSPVGPTLFIVVLLLVLLFLGIKFLPSLLSMRGQPTDTVSTPVAMVTALTQINNQPANTQVSLPLPQTETAIPASVTPSNTATQIPTVTLSATPPVSTPTSPASLITPVTPTVLYPNGYLMTAFYNANGFYMLDRGKGSRSASGFSFERVNKDGSSQNNYGGWQWEKTFKFIAPTRCLSIELYPDPNPYSIPTECANRVLSNVRIAPADPAIFWTPNDNSVEFRVLWLNQEIARCTIAAGACDYYVP